jgi:hypothetical protein
LRPKRRLPDLAALSFLLCLPLILFWPVTLGSRTLIPADNLYQWQPYHAFAAEQGVSLPPQNELLSDLVLENLVWKRFIVESLRSGEIPLWNPYLFGGVPFLAAGQHSALYPLSAVFYLLPVTRAYGLFTVLQLWMAGVFMYLFGRALRLGRFPALLAGIIYQGSAFFLVSVVFTMIIAAAAWLPLLLALLETMARKQEEKGTGPFVPILYVVTGSLALGIVVLAGHPEILVYTLMVLAYYAALRFALVRQRVGSWQPALRLAGWSALMLLLGLGLGSVQLIPLLELVTRNFREGSVTYADVVGWAYPARQVITFLIPDFFGNPAHHGYLDLVDRAWVPVDRIFWGIKNYVEAGSYAGILPLVLALVAVAGTRRQSESWPQVWIWTVLAVVSLLLIFGTPLYAVLYYGLPGIKQLHSPFRWVFPYTLSIAVLAGFGAQWLGRPCARPREASGIGEQRLDIARLLMGACLWTGGLLLVLLFVVWIAPQRFVPWADRVLSSVEKAGEAFSDGQMLLSYQWRNLLVFGLMLAASGLVLWARRRGWVVQLRRSSSTTQSLWKLLAVGVVAADLLLFGSGFNPAADPAWLGFTPPSVEFLQARAGAAEPWRLTTYRPEGSTKTLNPNIPWLHNLQDIRGYDSIIPAQYVTYMRAIEEQGELLYNQIAAIHAGESQLSPSGSPYRAVRGHRRRHPQSGL